VASGVRCLRMRRHQSLPERLLPPLALGIFALGVAVIIWAAVGGGSLACDYLAYDSSIRRFLDGGPLYIGPNDPTGPCGYFYYPPPFVLFVLPLTLVPPEVAGWLATGLLVAAFLGGTAILPVRPQVRWAILLLGGLSWPLLYAIKLGQVGPVLYLVFAAGWRWLDRPVRLGTAITIGAVIKVQPLLLVVWSFLTGRRRATWVALGVFAALVFVATIVTGPGSWAAEVNLLVGRSRPTVTEGLVTPGRIAADAGLDATAAWVVQAAAWLITGLVVLFVLVRGSAVASYLAVLIASQFISPILWDHYALVLLIPVAWLLDRGVWIAAVIPLLSTAPLVLVTPPVVYPIEYLAALALVAWDGLRDARYGAGPGWSPRREGDARRT